jgi:hypothetical protein
MTADLWFTYGWICGVGWVIAFVAVKLILFFRPSGLRPLPWGGDSPPTQLLIVFSPAFWRALPPAAKVVAICGVVFATGALACSIAGFVTLGARS